MTKRARKPKPVKRERLPAWMRPVIHAARQVALYALWHDGRLELFSRASGQMLVQFWPRTRVASCRGRTAGCRDWAEALRLAQQQQRRPRCR